MKHVTILSPNARYLSAVFIQGQTQVNRNMNSTQRRAITRNRELLACTECRRRKLKCDRHTPCNSCARRGHNASCVYQRSANGLEQERERYLQAEARLEHLERLVQQLAQHGEGSTPNGILPLTRCQTNRWAEKVPAWSPAPHYPKASSLMAQLTGLQCWRISKGSGPL